MQSQNETTNLSEIERKMNTQQAADFLFCSEKKVLEMAGIGLLRGAKIGKSWVFLRIDVSNFLKNEIERQTTQRANRYRPPSLQTNKPSKPQQVASRRRINKVIDLTPYQQQLEENSV